MESRHLPIFLYNIIMSVTYKDLDNRNLFGKDHGKFRQNVMSTVIDNIEQKYISLFRFEGDEELTIGIQRQLFKAAFRNGTGAIADLTKIVKGQIYTKVDANNELSDRIDSYVESQLLKKEPYIKRYPLYASPIFYDAIENVTDAIGISAPRNNKNRIATRITNENSAFLKYNHTSYTGLVRWIAYAYLFAENQVVYKKRLSLIDAKFGVNNQNNSYAKHDFEKIYDTDEAFINLSPSQKSQFSQENGDDVSIDKLISQKLFKINFAENETILNIIESIKANKNAWYWLNGEVININAKGERNTSGEVDDDKIHFELMKNEFRDQCELFIEQYKKVFGIQLTLIDVEEEIKDKMMEKQALIAGRENENGKDRDQEI